MSDSEWAGALLQRIAVPRIPGSSEIGDVQTVIVEQLERSGYGVKRERFRASARPLIAASIAGSAFGWTVLMLVPLLVLDFTGWTVALVGAAALALAVLASLGIANGYLPVKIDSVDAINVCATRGHSALWLVAHSDSKGQGLSLAGRVSAVVLLGAGLILLASCLVVRLWTPLPWWAVAPAVVLTVTGGAGISRKAVTNESFGAVDNATGVIAALVAAERLRGRSDVGVLITGAEEFAMAGAKAWATAHGANGIFINFDGVDGRGIYRVTTHPTPGAAGGRQSAELGAALVRRLQAAGADAKLGSLPPGILVDGVVLAKAGMPGVSLSRGDWKTLRVVHTVRDVHQRVDVGAAVLAGRAAAAVAEELLG